MLAINLCLIFIFVALITTVAQNNEIQRHELPKTYQNRSSPNLNLPDQILFNDSITITHQSTINTTDQSSISSTDQSTNTKKQIALVDCDGRCNSKTLMCGADGSRCICKGDYVDISPENSDTKKCIEMNTNGCQRGWKRLDDAKKCLRVFNGTKINVSNTSEFCTEHDSSAQLAILDSRKLALFAGKLASNMGPDKMFLFAVPSDTDITHWVWPSGKHSKNSTSAKALDFELIDSDAGIRCATIVSTNESSHWADASCRISSADGFICEMDFSDDLGDIILLWYWMGFIVVCAIALSTVLCIAPLCIAWCTRTCFSSHRKHRSDSSKVGSHGQENIRQNSTSGPGECVKMQSVRCCKNLMSASKNVRTPRTNSDAGIPIAVLPRIAQSCAGHSSDDDGGNKIVAIAINLHSNDDVQVAVASYPSENQRACEIPSPFDAEVTKTPDGLEKEAEGPPTNEDKKMNLNMESCTTIIL